MLESAGKNPLIAANEMPDFVVKQQIQRSAAYAGTTFQNLDQVVVAVSYRSTGEEGYRVLSTNGVLQQNSEVERKLLGNRRDELDGRIRDDARDRFQGRQ